MASTPDIPIAGRVVAITGAARGIGLATAHALARAGAKVAIGDLDRSIAAESAAAVGAGAIGLPLDVTDRDSFEGFLDATSEQLGPIDVLVNNAGIMFVGPFTEESDGSMRKMTEVNVFGTIIGMKLAIARMQGRGGHIVNIASGASWVGPPGESTYASTKHAVKGVCEGVRHELAGSGIELSLIFPGVVATELAAGTNPGRSKMLSPDDVADAIVACIRRPRYEVFVPRQNGALLRLYAGLPPAARTRIQKLFAVDEVAGKADHSARAEYERRISAS